MLTEDDSTTAMDGKLGLTPREVQQCKRLFQTFDEDNSGTIDTNELREVMRCLGSTLNDAELSELMASIDTNDSGEVEYHEFLFLIKLYKESCRFKTLHKSKVATERIQNATKTALLLPDDPFHWVWTVVILVTTLYFTIVATYFDTQVEMFATWLLPFHCVASLVFIVDILISNRTMVISSRESIQRHEKATLVNMPYVRTWFAADLVSALPLDVLFVVLEMKVPYLVTAHLRLLRLCKVPFLFKTSPRSTMTKSYAIFYFHYVPIIQGIFWWVTAIHLITCSSLAISPSEDYITAIYWVLYTITSVGYGDVPVESKSKKVLACLLCIGGLLVNGIMVGILTVKMQKTNVVSEGREKMVETLSLMRLFHIPEKLQEEILAFQHHLIDNTLSTSVSKVIDKLPSTIKDNVEMFIKLDFISQIPIFFKIPEDCKITLAASLLNTIASPEEILMMVGDAAEKVMFITHGFVDVFADAGEACDTRARGEFFGEDVFRGRDKSTISAKSLTYCDILILPKGDVVAIMKIYPTFINIVRQELATTKGCLEITGADSTAKPPTDTALTDNGSLLVKLEEPKEEILPIPVIEKPKDNVGGGGGGGGGGGLNPLGLGVPSEAVSTPQAGHTRKLRYVVSMRRKGRMQATLTPRLCKVCVHTTHMERAIYCARITPARHHQYNTTHHS